MQIIMDINSPDTTVKCWVDLYSDKMYTWALHKTSRADVAEDLVQETFLAAFESISKFEGKSEPKTWLFAILNNKIAEYFRKQLRNPTITESQSDTSLFDTLFDANDRWIKEQRPKAWPEELDNLLNDAAFIKILQACMGKLPGNWMAAVQLKYLEEKKGAQICQELGITPTNFWQILHRAKLQLRKCLELNWFKK